MDAATVRIEPATVLEWPEIDSMRRAYFASVNRPLVENEAGVWFVARIGERVCGAFAALDYEELGQRYVTEFYRVDGFDGTRATLAMIGAIERSCEADNLDMAFFTDTRNASFARHMVKRDFEPVGILFRKAFRKVAA